MWWPIFIILQAYFIFAGIRNEERAGLWSWSKFAFALGFGALEIVIVLVPIFNIGLHSRYFVPVFAGAWIIAGLNFVWMINRRSPLEASRWPPQPSGLPPPTSITTTGSLLQGT
jgi:hypothetical protein